MFKRSCWALAVFAATYAAMPIAIGRADIIKIQNPGSTCAAGLCNGGVPFSLTDIENGTQTLTIGGTVGSAATYIVKDDIPGNPITTVKVDLTGTIASNQFLDIQFGGGFSGTGTLSPNDMNCTVCGGNNGHADFFNPSPGGNGSTQVSVNDLFTWSLITPSIAYGTVFEIQFSSFANSAVARTTSVAPVPEPATLSLFITGLGALGLLGWRRKRKAQAN